MVRRCVVLTTNRTPGLPPGPDILLKKSIWAATGPGGVALPPRISTIRLGRVLLGQKNPGRDRIRFRDFSPQVFDRHDSASPAEQRRSVCLVRQRLGGPEEHGPSEQPAGRMGWVFPDGDTPLVKRWLETMAVLRYVKDQATAIMPLKCSGRLLAESPWMNSFPCFHPPPEAGLAILLLLLRC